MREQFALLTGVSLFLAGLIHVIQINHSLPAKPNDQTQGNSEALIDIAIQEARKLLSEKTTLFIDARMADKYDIGHINGAINIPPNHLDEGISIHLALLASSTKVIVYCDSTQCDLAKILQDRLIQLGLTKVFVLRGGYESWRQTG